MKWETYSAPLMGDRAQGVINNQVVTSCDMAIGVFWTRLGSPTGASESGTAEEIEWFINNNKPVMIYFSSRDLNPSKLDIDQYSALKSFENKMQKIGLTGSYTSITDFKEQLFRQLSINVKILMAGEPIKLLTEKEAKTKTESLERIIKQGQVFIQDYEKNGEIKSFLVKGDTTPIKDDLKAMGGRWNNSLKGWIFSKSKEIEVAEYLKRNT